MGSFGASAVIARSLLGQVQDAYDQHRFIDAFRLSAPCWSGSTDLGQLSIDELVLAGRLSARLGGLRLSRRLLMAARERDCSNPLVRYYTQHLRTRGRNLFDDLRAFEERPDLGGDRDDLRASWFAYYGCFWAGLRDFDRAMECIERARSFNADHGWVQACHSDVLGMMDRWSEALDVAEEAWTFNPGAPYVVDSLATALLNLGRVAESSERLVKIAETSQSYQVHLTACWHQCALAETLERDERDPVIERARSLAGRMKEFAPLADRDSRAQFARAYLDIADLADDHAEMEKWATEVRSHFYRKVLANLKQNPQGVRIRLPFRRTVQKHAECVPTSIASALAANGVDIPLDQMAAEVTFGGTAEWAAAEWLRNRGLHVRFFAVTPELASRLIRSRIAFTVVWDDDESGHAVAVVGLDEAAGTVIVHDPQSFRSTEYLLSTFTESYSPLGMMGMAAVPAARANDLDELLPPEAEIVASSQEHLRALALDGPSAGHDIVDRISLRFHSHPGTRYMQAVQAAEDGKIGEALRRFRELMGQFPTSAIVRYRLLNAYRSAGNTALLRETLRGIVETGTLPGVQSHQDWVQPHQRYICEYADLLRLSSGTRERARKILHSLLAKRWISASAWHTLGDLYWSTQEKDAALLCYRLGAALSESNEHFARAYADTLFRAGRRDEAFDCLEQRVTRHGTSPFAVSTWVTWIGALEDWGEPERAITACNAALDRHGSEPDLLVFAVPFMARMGNWQSAEQLLSRLQQSKSQGIFHSAAVYFCRMRGEPRQALEHAKAWLAEVPRSISARYALLDLLVRVDGSENAVETAAAWIRQQPGSEDLEEAYCQHVDSGDESFWRKARLLGRRLKRNPEDGWAWRELAFAAIYKYELAQEPRRARLSARIERLLSECDRTCAEDAATLRAHALWLEANGDWENAVSGYLEAIRREPDNFYAYRRAWESSCRLSEAARVTLWEEMEPMLLQCMGYLPNARDMAGLLCERFGVRETEAIVAKWLQQRNDNPNVVEAAADLLIDHGHGHSDAERALAMLKVAVARFPYHSGLRFSMANAYRGVGDHAAATTVFRELIERHPDNVGALIQLAWVQYREQGFAAASQILDVAATREPRNPDVPDARAQMLIQDNRLEEARQVIESALAELPKSVRMRERAIAMLTRCGFDEQAVIVAREGVVHYPRGAYMWLLLGRLLRDMPQFAAHGEIESSLRRGLDLNPSLFEAADLLSLVLADQRQYDDAAKVMRDIEKLLADPSPARGRLAWIRRQQGMKREAVDDLAATVSSTPWYAWGWNLLISWLKEDESWEKSRELLGVVPPQMLTNVSFRLERLLLLQEAGDSPEGLDKEWNTLLTDFPEEIPLHLRRYDSLSEKERFDDAAAVIEKVLPIDSDNPYTLARLVEVRCRQGRQEEAFGAALHVCLSPVEESVWPANRVWEVLESHRLVKDFRKRLRARLDAGDKPTRRALSLYASYMMKRHEKKLRKQSLERRWLPGRGACELLRLLKMIDCKPWGDDYYRADLFSILCEYGYHRLVIDCGKRLERNGVELNTEAWSQVGRAMVGAGSKRSARTFFHSWRERTGIGMWAIANYILALSRFRHSDLREIISSCEDAMAGLPHDHCARYLAHMQAEACALAGDKDALLKTWDSYAAYFGGQLENGEYFRDEDRHLLGDIPMLVRFLQQNRTWLYRRTLWGIRLNRIFPGGETLTREHSWAPLIRALAVLLFLLLIRLLSDR